MADDNQILDDILIRAMLDPDRAIAAKARELFDARHASDFKPPEPQHCAECFEGCPKCQPGKESQS